MLTLALVKTHLKLDLAATDEDATERLPGGGAGHVSDHEQAPLARSG
jgi:hypothetical protein